MNAKVSFFEGLDVKREADEDHLEDGEALDGFLGLVVESDNN